MKKKYLSISFIPLIMIIIIVLLIIFFYNEKSNDKEKFDVIDPADEYRFVGYWEKINVSTGDFDNFHYDFWYNGELWIKTSGGINPPMQYYKIKDGYLFLSTDPLDSEDSFINATKYSYTFTSTLVLELKDVTNNSDTILLHRKWTT